MSIDKVVCDQIKGQIDVCKDDPTFLKTRDANNKPYCMLNYKVVGEFECPHKGKLAKFKVRSYDSLKEKEMYGCNKQ